MFTGLIEEIGTVKGLKRAGDGYELAISAGIVTSDLKRGDSISINGACQTVISCNDSAFTVFVSEVTVSITTLGSFKNGNRVNLERAMTGNSRFGGHIVQGHVDGKGIISSSDRDANGMKLRVSLDPPLCRYIVPKGSVAVNGVSLTVVDAGKDFFTLYLIPETLGATTLAHETRGSSVNIEVDILAKYVEKMLSPRLDGEKKNTDDALMKKLIEEGY